MKIQLSWKVPILIPENGNNHIDTNKLFNIKTNKSFLNRIGGIHNLNFFPYTLEPTNIFYHALENVKKKNNFTGKKFPFILTNKTNGSFISINFKIHLFSQNLIIVSVKLNAIDFSDHLNELEKNLDIRNYAEIFNLTRTICGLIISGNKKSFIYSEIPKSYPCVIVNDNDDLISDDMAVELLTRHKNVNSNIIKKVLLKNENHQVDKNNIVLIDRQGIFAKIKDIDAIKRKVESAENMLELAIAVSKILSDNYFNILPEDHKKAIIELINNPDIVFLHSITGQKTWELLLTEFKLVELFSRRIPIMQEETIISKLLNRMKWFYKLISHNMISGIIIIFITLYASSWYQNNQKINIHHPIDRKTVKTSKNSCNFEWEAVDNAVDYKILLQKFDSEDKSWKDLTDNAIYISKLTNKTIELSSSGKYQWKIIARDKNTKTIGESDFYEFMYELQEAKK